MCIERIVKSSKEEMLFVKSYLGKDMLDSLMHMNYRGLEMIQYEDIVVEIALWDKICTQPLDAQHKKLVVLTKGRVALEVIIDLEQRYCCKWNTNMYCIRKLEKSTQTLEEKR